MNRMIIKILNEIGVKSRDDLSIFMFMMLIAGIICFLGMCLGIYFNTGWGVFVFLGVMYSYLFTVVYTHLYP